MKPRRPASRESHVPSPVHSKLEALFRPKSVAVLGAARTRGSLGAEMFHNILSCGFNGPVYPVNPSAPAVQSVAAYKSVLDVPGEVDLAVVMVPRDHVMAAVDDCIRKGVKALIVVSAGFGEVDAAGKELQDAMLAKVRLAGIRMVGPNCLGVINTAKDVSLNAIFSPNRPPPGNVAFSSQSGAVGVAIIEYAKQLGIGISQFISVGNKADVSGNDLLEYWENDPSTDVILLYLESFGNPHRFLQIARRVSRKKPILLVKSGRTAAGARAAASHTGSLAGSDVAVEALLAQSGVLRANTIEELFDSAMLLANQPPPRGNRVAIVTNAGGPGIMCADACEARGLALPQLSRQTEYSLREFLPAAASVRNPVDMIASATPENYERAVSLLLEDPNVDAAIVLFVQPLPMDASTVADAIRRGAAGTEKPVLTCLMGVHGLPAVLTSLRKGRYPSYSFPESAAAALATAVKYGQWLSKEEGKVPELDGISSSRGREVVESAAGGVERWLEPKEIQELLTAYGIRVPRAAVVHSPAEAAHAAAKMGFPVALKLLSRSITHKSDVGGVVLGLDSATAVKDAYRGIEEKVAKLGQKSEMEGVLVQEMVPRGVETIVGVSRDPLYGPLIGFGMGGIHVEIMRDVVFRVNPLTNVDAREMLASIRAHRLLDGYRGAPAADREALCEALLRVSRMAADCPEIVEMDINPLVALEPGKGAVAVDARIRVKGK